jgi:5-deoxy-glucuronate isomerase
VDDLFHVPAGDGYHQVLDQETTGLRWLAFGVLRLNAGDSWQTEINDEEIALVTMSGQCAVKLDGNDSKTWDCVGGRANVFGGMPHVVYVPRQSKVDVKALGSLEVAIVTSPCEVDFPARLLCPDDCRELSVGAGSWRRDVRLVMPPGSSASQRLIVGETLQTPGQWSGWPPHKHDSATETEYPLEELYYFKVKSTGGFGVQLIYTPEGRHDAVVVLEDDVTIFREGYHPYVGGPGSSSYYLWALAGPEKIYRVTTDPQWSWASEVEDMFRESKL